MLGFEVGGIGTPDQGGDPVFQIRCDDLIAERHGACLPYGFDLAHDRNDVKPGAEGARELDCRQQRLPAGYLIVEVNGE